MHLYKLNLLSQQGKLYLKAKTWILQCSRNSLFVNHRYLNQRNKRWGDLGLMFPIFFKATWFYLKKAEFDFNKICTHYSKGRDNFAVLKILSWQLFVFKEQTEGEGFGEGVWGGASLAGPEHLGASLRGGGPSKKKIEDSSGSTAQPARPEAFLTQSLFYLHLFVPYLLFNWSFHFQPGWDWCELCS